MASSAFVVVVTIWAELSPVLKDWLRSITGHHWTTKSVFSAIIFVVLLVVFYISKKNNEPMDTKRPLFWLLMSVVIGSVALALFYTGHHFAVW